MDKIDYIDVSKMTHKEIALALGKSKLYYYNITIDIIMSIIMVGIVVGIVGLVLALI